MIIALPVLVCLVGLALYCLVDAARYPKLVHIGDVMFWVGLLVSLLYRDKIVALIGG